MRNEPEPHAGSSTRIFANSFGVFPLNQFSDRVLHDVIDDVGWGVIDTACFFNLRFRLNLHLPSRSNADHLPEKLLVDLAEDVRWNVRKSVGAIRIIDPFQYRLKASVVNLDRWSERVRILCTVLLLVKVKQARVITFIALPEEVAEVLVNIVLLHEIAELAVSLQTTVLANAQEDDPIDDSLNREVHFRLPEFGIPRRDAGRQFMSPVLDILEERAIDFRGSFFRLAGFDEAVE